MIKNINIIKVCSTHWYMIISILIVFSLDVYSIFKDMEEIKKIEPKIEL